MSQDSIMTSTLFLTDSFFSLPNDVFVHDTDDELYNSFDYGDDGDIVTTSCTNNMMVVDVRIPMNHNLPQQQHSGCAMESTVAQFHDSLSATCHRDNRSSKAGGNNKRLSPPPATTTSNNYAAALSTSSDSFHSETARLMMMMMVAAEQQQHRIDIDTFCTKATTTTTTTATTPRTITPPHPIPVGSSSTSSYYPTPSIDLIDETTWNHITTSTMADSGDDISSSTSNLPSLPEWDATNDYYYYNEGIRSTYPNQRY